ncbi:MAG: hypothetical protein QF473_28880, partial [Planctomycetota bacterium]|nr:hypothetical protein [Planctomycetota bacterium]
MKRELSSEHRLPSNVNPSLYLPITLVFALAGTQAEDFKPLGFDKAAGWGKVQLPERAKSELGKRDEAGLNQLLAEAAKLNADKFSIGQIISRIAAEEIKAAGEDQARVIEIWRWMAGARMRRYDMAGGRALIHKTLLGHSAKQDEAVLTELGNCVDLLARFGSDVGDIWPMLDLIEQRFGNAGDDAKAKI